MAIKDGLISYWSLDEESDGTIAVPRLDSHGTNHLTDNNTTASATGLVGQAASFAAVNDAYLSAPNHPTLQLGTSSFSITLWFSPTTENTQQQLVAKDKGSQSFAPWTREYGVVFDGEDRAWVYLYYGDNHLIRHEVKSDPLPINMWHFIATWWDAATKTLRLQVNNGDIFEAVGAEPLITTDAPLTIGVRGDGNSYFAGLIDEIAVANRVWTAQERTFLYNGGAGRSYADFGGNAPNLIAAGRHAVPVVGPGSPRLRAVGPGVGRLR